MYRYLSFLILMIASSTTVFMLDADPTAKKGLLILTIISSLWISEVIPISVTSLLVPVLGVVLGIVDVKEALSPFAHPIIFLFFGGFVLAIALSKYELDRFVAYKIAKVSGGSFLKASFLLMLTTAFISMWISNTSTTAMMLPLALGIIRSVENPPERNYTFLLLGIAYSASVGGMGTLVGSPPNGIAAGLLNLSFADWFSFGIPFVLILLPVLFFIMYMLFKPLTLRVSLREDFSIKWGVGEISVFVVFFLTVVGWLFSKQISSFLGIGKYTDSIIALFAVILLASLRLISWYDIKEKTDWGTLYLFGGGLALSNILKVSGGAKYLSDMVADMLGGLHPFFIILFSVLFIIFMTELMSNTATTAIFAPILLSTAQGLGIPPEDLIIPTALAASCAFMLPVATPPNAIVYGSGFIKQTDMIRAGILLNLCLGTLISIVAYIIL